MAIFVFAGCDGIGTPAEGEGEGEGEGEIKEVVVEVEDETAVGGKNYVKGGVSRDITVTFPEPVENALVYVSGCGEVKGEPDKTTLINANLVAMWPNEDQTVWTGSYTFTGEEGDDCCSSYIMVEAGECEADVCVYHPVIVDTMPPEATVEVCLDECECEGCELSFESTSETECDVTELDCGDDCSGLASWSIAVFDFDGYDMGETPYDDCCDVPCDEPIFTCSETECPIDCTTDCLDELEKDSGIFVVLTLVDEVGNDAKYGAYMDSCDYDTCEEINLVPYTSGDAIDDDCLDDATDVFTICDDNDEC